MELNFIGTKGKVESFDDTKNIRAVMIIEVLGKPPEHLKETLKEIVEKIKNEKGVLVEESMIHEPNPLKDKPEFYTSFVEIEVKTETIAELIMLMFKYMPANIEVISPEKVHLSNSTWSEVLSELVRKLHAYDEVTRLVQVEKEILEKKLREILDKEKSKE